MDPRQRHLRSQELFLKARKLEAEAREAYLSEACRADSDLRGAVERLLAHDSNPLAFLAEPSADETGRHALRAKLGALFEANEGQFSLEPSAREDAHLLPTSIGKFHILRKIGEGGMGAVYEAVQEQPKRTVALKVLRPAFLSPEALRRFDRECEFLGRLQHPGIAQIFESGREETAHGVLPYLAMERIVGEPLIAHARMRALSISDRLELLARVADAVQHAHQNGVIHRDLKPSNILVDESGAPKILDFGIARAIDSDVRLTTMHTGEGQILGTLAYMSPEQASGAPEAIDTRSDVYSLGVLLYELLANRLPYDLTRKLLPDAVRAICEEEPRRLSTVASRLKGDVETMVRKALEKDKERRYGSAAELAADIRRYLRDEPILARPPSGIYLLQKFVRRNKTVVVATSIVFLVLIVSLIASLQFGFREEEQRFRAEKQRRAAENEAYRAQLSAAGQALGAGNFAAARVAHTRAAEHLRNWEWHHLDRQGIQELARLTVPDVFAATFQDSRRVLIIGETSVVRVWDVLTGEVAEKSSWATGQRALALSEDGHWLLTYTEGTLWLGDPLGDDPPRAISFEEGSPKNRLRTSAISKNAMRVAVTTEKDEVILLSLDGDSVVRKTFEPSIREVLSLKFSASGNWLAFLRDPDLDIWDQERGELLLKGGGSIAFAADENTLVIENETVYGAGAGLYFKDTATYDTLRALFRARYGVHHYVQCVDLNYSADQRFLALSYVGGDIQVLDAKAGLPWPPPPKPDPIRRSASLGNTRHGGEGRVEVALSEDGSRLLSLCAEAGSLRVWRTGGDGTADVCGEHEWYVYAVAFHPDNAVIASGGWDARVRLWDATLHREIVALESPGRGRCLAFSPDGRQLACGTDRELVLIDVRTNQRRVLASSAVNAVAFSPDGSLLAAAMNNAETHVWKTRGYEELQVLTGDSTSLSLAFNPRGDLLATGSGGAEVCLWDPTTGRQLVQVEESRAGRSNFRGARALAFAPDGSRLVVGWGDSSLSQHAVPSLDLIAEMPGHRGEVFSVAYSPDGSRIASGGRDGMLRIWEAESGNLLVELAAHSDYIMSLAFSPEGKRIATGSGDKTVRVWESASVRAIWDAERVIEEARPKAESLVTRLYQELSDVLEIVKSIEAAMDLNPTVRRLALEAVLRREAAH